MPIEVRNLSKIQQLGTVDLDVHGAKLFTSSNDTTILSTATNPKWDVQSTGALSSANPLAISWSSGGAAVTIIAPTFSTPADWSTRAALTVNMVVGKATNIGAATIKVKMQAADPTNGLLTSSAITGAIGSSAPSLVTATIAASALPGVNSVINWGITPSTSADIVRIYGGWISYQRQPSG